jgi:DNA-binding transcriptional regulator WhiA
MTEPLPQKQAQSRLELAEIRDSYLRNSVEEDLKQFKRLRIAFPDLTDEELAHRLAMPMKQLRKVRKLLGE